MLAAAVTVHVQVHVASDAWWKTAIVALGAAVVGGALTGWVTWQVFKRQERAALAREVRQHVGGFLGALYVGVGLLMDVPADVPDNWRDRLEGRLKGKLPDEQKRRYEAAAWVRTQKAILETIGDGPRRTAEDIVRAAAPLIALPLPPELDAAITAALDYARDLAAVRTDEVKVKWPGVVDELLRTVRAFVVDADELVRALGSPPTTRPRD